MADGAASLPSTPSGVDRLSDLHDDLLHEIITRLPVIEAVHTAVLAKRWRHLWSSSPLVLRDHDLPKPARDALVPRILREHPGPFLSIRLTDCRLGDVGEIPGWPRHLADRRTQKLFLANRVTRTRNQPLPNALPRLPADLLRCRSLQKLSLCFWEFPVDLCRGGISLPHLQQLDLVMIIAGDQDLEDLIAACPVLKTLTLSLINTNRAKHIRFRSPSLRGVLVGLWGAIEEFTVLNAPLLERLLLFLRGNGVRVKIGCAAKLQVLGHLDARAHRLQIYDNAIELNTMMTSTSTVIPSVKMLVVMVNFGVLREVKMLASFLRCFPNIDTLHIKSALQDPSVTANAPRGEHHASSWQDISPVQCLRSHVKKMVIHNFRGLPHEFEFLNFIAMNAQELQSLDVVLQQEAVSSTDMVDEITDKLQFLRLRTGISGVLLVLPKIASDSILHRETGLNRNIDEPFSF